MSKIIRKNRQVILTISDIHFPFNHPKALDFLTDLKNEFKPTQVVALGDHLDLYKLSRYVQSPEAYGASEEISMGLYMMQRLYKIFPSDVMVCNSNHSARVSKKVSEAGLPSRLIRSEKEWLQCPESWEFRDHWLIKTRTGPVHFWHGEPYSSSNWHSAPRDMHINCVMGHVHSKAGIHFFRNQRHQLWVMNAGCLIDVNSYAFDYGKFSKAKPTIGTGLVIDGSPMFVPLL